MKTILDYADLVKEQHALNTTIAPVETDLTSASQDYAVGQKFVYDGVLYQAKAPIAQGAALVLNTNYEAADDVSSEIEALTHVRAELGAHNLFGVGDFSEWFAAGSDGKLPLEFPASATITAATDKNTNSITVTNYDSSGYRWGCKKVNLKKNTRYVFSFASITGTMRFFGKNDADAQATLIANLPATVNTGNYDTYYVGFYPTVGGGYFTATNMLVKLETDADTTFQQYAKSNQELTAENQTLTKGLEDEAATRSVLGAKNILPFDLADIKALNTNGTWAGNVYTYRDVDFTVNADGTVTANGTATGGNASIKLYNASANYEMLGKKVILNGCPSGGSATTYRIQAYRMGSADGSTGTYFDDGEGTIPFDALNNASGTVGSFAVAVYENATATNLLFKPMVRLASDPDDTYRPYVPTNAQLLSYKDNGILGAKNFLPNQVSTTAGNVTGITHNDDGTVTIAPRTGIPYGEIYFSVRGTRDFFLPNGTYIMSGGRDSNIFLRAGYTDKDGQYAVYGDANVTDLIFTVDGCNLRDDGAYLTTWLYVNGDVSSQLTIYPMIRLATDSDDTYQPCAMTNRELTEIATYKKNDTIAISSNPLYLSALFQDSKHLRLTIPINKPISASGATVTIGSMEVFNNGTYEDIASGITATAYKLDGVGLYVVIENAIDFATFTAFANATVRLSNPSIAFT